MESHTKIDTHDFENSGHKCPCHRTSFRKIYTHGSTMSAETDVYTFVGCQCAVAVRHDSGGFYPSVATYHKTYGEASGTGRLHAALTADKYR